MPAGEHRPVRDARLADRAGREGDRMVTRRQLLVGSAAMLGTLGVAGGTPAAAEVSGRPLAAALPAGAVSGFQLPGGVFCPVPFMSRSAWGADESLRYTNNGGYWPEEYYPVLAITVHHTGFVADADPAQTVRDIYTRQTLHGDGSAGSIGWGDIGYHLLIDDQGVVYEGRYSGSDASPIFNPVGAMVTAAHVLHYNTGNIGVCLLGYLDDAPATQAAQASLVTVLAYLAAVGHVNPTGTVHYVNRAPGYENYTKTVNGISGHRNWAATDCPGSAFYPLLSGIRSQVAAVSVPTPSQSTSQPPSPSTSTTGGSDPTPSGSPTSSPSGQPTTPTPTPHPSTTTKTGPRDRGGDEYVPAARRASPSAFPTKHPSPTPTAGLTPSPSAAPSYPMATPTPTWAPPAVPPVSDGGTPVWGVSAAVAGVAAAGTVGSLGARWWRQRHSAQEPGTAGLSTVDAQATSVAESVAQPPASDEPQRTESSPLPSDGSG